MILFMIVSWPSASGTCSPGRWETRTTARVMAQTCESTISAKSFTTPVTFLSPKCHPRPIVGCRHQGTNLYPTPCTVSRWRGSDEFSSTFALSEAM